MVVVGQGDQAASEGELACTSVSQFAPASDFVGFVFGWDSVRGLVRIFWTLSPKTRGVGISGRGCAAWFGNMVEATYLV